MAFSKKQVDYPDVFMQFRTIAHVHHASNHTTLTENFIETGLEIRGGLGWLIHAVEIERAARPFSTSNVERWAISTRRGEAAIPTYGDRGCLMRHGCYLVLTSSGASYYPTVEKHQYRPPVIIASRYLVSYFEMGTDDAALDGLTSYVRFSYTTIALKPGDYVELNETWGA